MCAKRTGRNHRGRPERFRIRIKVSTSEGQNVTTSGKETVGVHQDLAHGQNDPRIAEMNYYIPSVICNWMENSVTETSPW